MKHMKFEDWYILNRSKLETLAGLWFLPKKWSSLLVTVLSALDLLYTKQIQNLATSLDDRDVLPCIRVNADGSTTLVNCKTGVEIPKKD